MEKYLVSIEFRYDDVRSPNSDDYDYVTKKVTIGVFDTRDEANTAGNAALEIFEKHFPLNENYNKKERFSNNGGAFGRPKDLITNSAYLRTPFSFFAKISKLKYLDVEESIIEAKAAAKRYRAWKASKN